MKFKQIILALALAALAGGAAAAPSLQTCAPMEVTHAGDSGLTYLLACEAGAWHLHYAGTVPAGDDIVNAQYRLTVAGPGGTSFVQNRTVRLPSPAKLGQMLMREAVLLDSGDLALRDCKELGCTQYRPLTSGTELAKASVTLTPEAKRLRDEQLRLTQEADRLRAEVAAVKLQGIRDREAITAEEGKKSEKALTAAKEQLTAYEVKVAARIKAENDAAAVKLESERKGALSALTAEQASRAKQVATLEAEIARLMGVSATLTRERDLAQDANKTTEADLAVTRKSLAYSLKYPMAQRAAYEFALAGLVAQHNEQLASLKRAMPDTNFAGIVDEISAPKVVVQTEPAAAVTPSAAEKAPVVKGPKGKSEKVKSKN